MIKLAETNSWEDFIMSLKESAEMYLETIYTLSKTHSYVRSIDVAEALG